MPTDSKGRQGAERRQQAAALQTRVDYEAAHPEVEITTPLTSRSGLWELFTEGSITTFSGVWAMLDFLAAQSGAADDD